MTFSCWVKGLPQPKGSKRAVWSEAHQRPLIFDQNAPKMRTWERAIQWVVQNEWQGLPLEGPVRLWLVFVFPLPKSAPKRHPPTYKETKPDASKLLRCVEDALTGIAYRDDAQIGSLIVEKRYGDEAGVGIAVEGLEAAGLFPVEARRA
jgi:Holliday junction resolvase RusA-like endonuclease